MSTNRWEDILARVSRNEPENLDGLLTPYDPRATTPGDEIFPEHVSVVPFASEFRSDDTIAIGVRVEEPLPDPAERAVQLGAFAIERNVEVVVLSHMDYSGFERFGFRTERISGKSEAARAACERQLAGFWHLEVII